MTEPDSQDLIQTFPITQEELDVEDYSDHEDHKASPPVWCRFVPNTPCTYSGIAVSADEFKFGRDPKRCEMALNEPQISGVHTKIVKVKDESHTALLYDLSTNGTFINKRKIGKGNHAMLFDRDEITFIQYAKQDKKTKKERKKLSFIFYTVAERKRGGIFDKYDLRDTLGTGSFAVVKLGISRETGKRYAVKQIDKMKYELKSKSRKSGSINNEWKIMKEINHPNIITVYDIYDTEKELYLVLEMATGGELFHRIVDHKRLAEDICRHVTKQLLNAIMYLHSKKIAHRDLKPENILMVTRNGWDIKISDFGLSRILNCSNEMLTTMCGTPLFLAPEVLISKKNGGYGFEVDYWSMGVILYLMLVGHPPYNEKEGALLELVRQGRFSFPKLSWSKVSQSARHLVQQLMTKEPSARITGKQIQNHPWMKGEAMLHKVQPEKAPTAVMKNNTQRGFLNSPTITQPKTLVAPTSPPFILSPDLHRFEKLRVNNQTPVPSKDEKVRRPRFFRRLECNPAHINITPVKKLDQAANTEVKGPSFLIDELMSDASDSVSVSGSVSVNTGMFGLAKLKQQRSDEFLNLHTFASNNKLVGRKRTRHEFDENEMKQLEETNFEQSKKKKKLLNGQPKNVNLMSMDSYPTPLDSIVHKNLFNDDNNNNNHKNTKNQTVTTTATATNSQPPRTRPSVNNNVKPIVAAGGSVDEQLLLGIQSAVVKDMSVDC